MEHFAGYMAARFVAFFHASGRITSMMGWFIGAGANPRDQGKPDLPPLN